MIAVEFQRKSKERIPYLEDMIYLLREIFVTCLAVGNMLIPYQT